jgi:hypothetical protein
MKSACSFTKKEARPEPAADSDIEIVECPAKEIEEIEETMDTSQ